MDSSSGSLFTMWLCLCSRCSYHQHLTLTPHSENITQAEARRTRMCSMFHWNCSIPDLLFWSALALISDTARQPVGVFISHLLRALETMRTLQRSQIGSVALYCSFLSFDIMPRLCLRWRQFVPLCGRPVSCALAVLSNTGCHNCFRETECWRRSPTCLP